jgi:hypothetical protein
MSKLQQMWRVACNVLQLWRVFTALTLYLMCRNHPFPCFIEQLLIVSDICSRSDSLSYHIVVAEPQDPERQQKWILVTSRVSQF